MNKKINISKIIDYDKFKCTADKCKFTCCEGSGYKYIRIPLVNGRRKKINLIIF